MQELLRKIRQILEDRRTRKFFARVITSIAAIVVFVTTYAMILPAITMEKTAICGIEEHQHNENCYEERIVCGLEESEGHHHVESCYLTERELTCGIQEHRHSADKGCFDADGNLICELQEHVHDDSCYEEIRTLTCGQEEGEGHRHTDACYETILTCGKEVHTHSRKCYEEDGSTEFSEDGNSAGRLSDPEGAGDTENSGDINSGDSTDTSDLIDAGDAENTGNTGNLMPETAGPDVPGSDAAAEEAQSDSYVSELDPLGMEVMLNNHTGFYYYHSGEGEDVPADSAEITNWRKVEKETILAPSDLVRMYLAYTIPAGSLNETNPAVRYRLPDNLHLTDQQIDVMDRYENGIAVGYRDYDAASDSDEREEEKENYQKYLGAEAVEGDRRPDGQLKDGAQEYISAVVRAENVYDDEGKYLGQDLIFTFVPYSVEKNRNTYAADKSLISAGEEITGWFACDFTLDQIDWETEEANEEGDRIREEARVIFVQEDQEKEIPEISRALKMFGEVEETGEIVDGASAGKKKGPHISTHVITADGKDYLITVTCGTEAGIPDDADLSVEEISKTSSVYDKYVSKTESALGMEEGTVGYIRLFDISIVNKDDHSIKYQPEAGTTVDVCIELEDKDSSEEAAANTQVVHFADGSDTGDVVDVQTDGQTVSFEASGFSIYAVVDDTKIITVNFYDGNGNFISSEYVKKNGDEIEDLYSPGFELDYGERFYGWATSQDASNGMDIDALNASFKSNWNTYTEDTPVNYYAVVKKVYVVTFNKYDEEGDLIVLRTVSIPLDQADKTIIIPGDLGAEVGNDFQGWLGQNGTLYTEGQSFTVSDHYTFFMKEQGRYWLVFDSNAGGPGSGATYTPPQLIYGEGVVTEQPENPIRKGYSFLGWNTSPDGSGTWWYKTDGSVLNRFGGTISADTTLYAQWEGDLTKYYVLYWQQDVGDDAGLSDDQKHYHYVGSREVTTARTGDTVSTINSDRNKAGTAGYEQYHYNGTKSETTTTVAADGTTTLNVYYDLNEYTLSFQVTGYIYTPTTSNTGTQYGYYNNSYVQLYYNNGTWYRTRSGGWSGYTYSNPYNGTRYTRSGGNNTWSTIKTINALYGHNISDQFPIVGTNGVTYNNGERWMPQSNNVGFNQVMVYLDVMPGGNVVFRLNTASHTTKHMHYYVEALPGQTATRTYNGRGFVEYTSFDANYNYFTEAEDYVDLVGFSKSRSFPPEGYTSNNGKVNNVWNNSNAVNVYCYYLRNKYNIHFVSVSDGRQETVEEVYYEQSLTDYADVIPTNGLDGFAFVGWYSDESCAPGTEFDFETTMPTNDITLYAKWEEQRCRVVLDPNAPVGEYSFANNQALAFRLDYNDKVDATNITGNAVSRPGYKLDGWYTEDGNLWNFDTLVNGSVDGVNPDYQSTTDWIDNVYGDNDGEHNNIKNILKLKAKWKLDIAENSVYVIYKVNDVYYTYNANGDLQTIVPVDDTAYVLQEGDTDFTFRTAPAPSGYNDGYVFRDWALLTSSGEKSGTTFLDGSQALVDEEYFVTETIVDDDGNTGTLRYVVLEAQFDPNENRATAVVYNGNGGTTGTGHSTIGESYLVNKVFTILDGDVFKREGYTFVEWNTKADGSGTSLEAGAEVAADNLEGTAWDSVGRTNNLYAIWTINTYTVTVKKVVDGDSEGKTFTFTATANGDYSLPTEDAGFSLADGGERQITEVPYGTVLTFTETPAAGFNIQSVDAKQISSPDKTPLQEADYIDLGGADNIPYTIKGDTVITYINEKAKEQKLRIRKIGDDAEDGLAGAVFSLTSSDAEGLIEMTGLVSMDETDPDNLGYLPGGDVSDETLFTLPIGTYTLTETEAPQYYDGLTGAVNLNVTGDGISITSVGTDEEAPFDGVEINNEGGIYTLSVTNTRKLATVTVIKNVIGNDADKDALYSFTAENLLETEDSFQLYGRYKDGLDDTPAQENTKEYQNIPYGTVFSISEESYADFNTTIEISNETEPVTTNRSTTGDVTVNGDVTITYTNTRNRQPVAIYKTGIDSDEAITTGAAFVLYKADEFNDETQTAIDGATIVAQGTTNTNGILFLGNLTVEQGQSFTEYRLLETAAPRGYDLPEQAMKIFIYPDRVYGTQGTGNMQVKDANDFSDITDKTTVVLRVWNNPGVVLPNTGGPGLKLFYLLGILLTGTAGVGAVIRKKGKI